MSSSSSIQNRVQNKIEALPQTTTQLRKLTLIYDDDKELFSLESFNFIGEIFQIEVIDLKKQKLSTSDCKTTVVFIILIKDKKNVYEICKKIRKSHSLSVFICVLHPDATEDAQFRQNCFLDDQQVNMVSYDIDSLKTVLKKIKDILSSEGKLFCPYCDAQGFTEDGLWYHSFTYHVNEHNVPVGSKCQLCDYGSNRAPFQVHYRNQHGPCGRGEVEPEKGNGVFGIVVCRRKSDGKFLMVQEFSQTGFWVPGGQLNCGEAICDGAIRETIEEAGIEIELKGILEIIEEEDGWRRVTFYAEPKNEEQKPKTCPDYESTGAVWVHVSELSKLKLRGREPSKFFPHVANGGEIKPLVLPKKYNWKDVEFLSTPKK